MLETIQKNGLTIKECIAKAKDKDDPFRLMGFGHRVYKTYDPRAKIMKKRSHNHAKIKPNHSKYMPKSSQKHTKNITNTTNKM